MAPPFLVAKPIRGAFVAAVVIFASPLFEVGAKAQEGGGPPPQTVTVVTVHAEDVTLTSTLPGRVVASGIAQVRPQVDGIIVERLFEEGSNVEVGDALYRIDPATYEALEAAADAAVAQASATLDTAQRDADRMEALLGRRVVSQQDLDDALSARDAAFAALKVAEAQLLAAQINLDRTTVRAPLTGKVGRTLTTQGALVTSGQAEPLAIIRALDPVYVDVTQSAADMIRWRRGQTADQLGEADTTVTLTLADGTSYEHSGELRVAEPHVNELTGVVLLRLEFANPEEFLLPGMYVRVEMPQGLMRDAIPVPQEGVQRDNRGRPYALVVNAENVVEQRDLTILRDRGEEWILEAGLADGDRVIVAGFQKTGPGATVVPEERDDPSVPPSDAQAAIGGLPRSGTTAQN
ncbi:MAG: efflux RND transporter periplasmic adaptor subunit [Pseudomonadota bacterium]